MPDVATRRPRFSLRSAWPWLVLALTVVPAVWHVVDFPDDLDPEFPRVARPTFNRRPPPAYRLAEPGDTIDRVGIYIGSLATVLATVGLLRSRGDVGLWPAAIGLSLAGLWHASTPGPTFDGWHGLGWRAIGDRSAPQAERIFLTIGVLEVVGLIVGNGLGMVGRWRGLWRRSGELRIRGLLGAAIVLVIARQFEIPGVEPAGYWPRWAYAWGLIAFALALVRALVDQGWPVRAAGLAWGLSGASAWFGLVSLGIGLTWFHRPLERLRTIEPGRIYLSAMPTYRGLEVAHARHGFKTIINIFPEDSAQRSPILPDEHRFVRERGLRYVEASAFDNDSDAFLDETLGIATDPAAWPILIHCHGSMDRSPGWMGIYRFLVQRRPLDEIMREIERHRGYRPKASITLLYNRVLGERAPDRYRADPTGRLLLRSANGVVMPPRSDEPRIGRAGEPPVRP